MALKFSIAFGQKIGLTFIHNTSDKLSTTICITRNTALIFMPTPCADNFAELDDFYSNENLKKVLADFK